MNVVVWVARRKVKYKVDEDTKLIRVITQKELSKVIEKNVDLIIIEESVPGIGKEFNGCRVEILDHMDEYNKDTQELDVEEVVKRLTNQEEMTQDSCLIEEINSESVTESTEIEVVEINEVDVTEVKEVEEGIDTLEFSSADSVKVEDKKEELLELSGTEKTQVETYNKLEDKIEEYNEGYTGTNVATSYEVAKLKKDLEEKTAEVDTLNKKLNEMFIELNAFRNRNFADISKEDLKILDDKNKWLQQKVDELTDKLKSEKDRYQEIIDGLNSDKAQLNKYIAESGKEQEEKEQAIKRNYIDANKMYNKLMEIVESLASVNCRLDGEVSLLSDNVKSLTEQLESTNEELQLTKSLLDSSEQRVESLEVAASNVEKRVQLVKEEEAQRVLEIANELKIKEIDLENYKNDNERLRKELVSCNDTLSSLSESIREVELLRSRINGLEQSEETLRTKVDILIKEKKELSDEINAKNDKISELRIELGNAMEDLTAVKMSGGSATVAKVRSLATSRYKGKAKIIAVYGTGSYGISTTVLSLAEKLSGKKLVMDLDIISPGMDVKLREKPLIANLGIEEALKSSAFGATIERGSTFAAANMHKLIKQVSARLDYFGGVYHHFNRSKLTGLNFSEIMESIPDVYDYIIIDCGKLNTSIEADCLIKTMHEMAHKSIVVVRNESLHVKGAIRNLKRMMIDNSKIVWVLNFSLKSSVDQQVSSIVKSNRVVITADRQLIGTQGAFDYSELLRGKTDEIINLIK